jgi:anti-sigma regulatory factor (Ser/Thr protein kinase)
MQWRIESGDYTGAVNARKQLAVHLVQRAEPKSDHFAALLIFGELVANALTHGRGLVEACVGPGSRCAILWVEDAGEGFVLERVPKPVSGKLCGRGIYIVTRLAPSVHVGRVEGDRFRVTAELPVRLTDCSGDAA